MNRIVSPLFSQRFFSRRKWDRYSKTLNWFLMFRILWNLMAVSVTKSLFKLQALFNKKSSTKHQRPESKVFESPFDETSRSHTLILHTCFMELCKCNPVSDRFIRRFTISYQDLINTLRMNRDFVFHPILFSFILCFDSLIFISSADFALAAIDRVATKEFWKTKDSRVVNGAIAWNSEICCSFLSLSDYERLEINSFSLAITNRFTSITFSKPRKWVSNTLSCLKGQIQMVEVTEMVLKCHFCPPTSEQIAWSLTSYSEKVISNDRNSHNL